YHLRFSASPDPLGKYVDIDNSLGKKRLKRERLEYKNARKIVKLLKTKVVMGQLLAEHGGDRPRPQLRIHEWGLYNAATAGMTG
ncbi:MAG: hypothetical protein ACR2LZ_11050, partial [Pyrinomonadaceae bacterium]